MMKMQFVPGTAAHAISTPLNMIRIYRCVSAVRTRVGTWVRSRVRLDTDPEPDPLNRPTPQAKAHNRFTYRTPTDPSFRGLPRGGIDA
jgi:hypothetical protein